MSKVVVIQRVLPHYRVAFFRRLHDRLRRTGIALHLVYGQERPGTVPRTVPLAESWATQIENRYWQLGSSEVVWQPCMSLVRGADLVVLEQANRLLANYPLLAMRRLGKARIAYWGHGRNMQSYDADGWAQRVRRATMLEVDWWFAYTDLSTEIVAGAGFPRERITTVQNTIDTSDLRSNLDACTAEEVAAARARHRIQGDVVGLYCGGMYGLKKLPFLIAACEEIRRRVPEFSAVFVGDGPDRTVVEAAAARHQWIYYVGAKVGRELAPYYRLSKVLLMPGMVGLAIVDSFVAGIPMFTTDLPLHSPEIAYLESGVNGTMTAHDVHAYAAVVAQYLLEPSRLARLVEGCKRSAAKYTIENMVENFARGIERCLGRD
jgi:glycosyltransferase involved in cell wall biosynthesis